MKKYVGLIVGVVVLVGVLAGAGILYTNLAADYGTGQNLVLTKEEDTIIENSVENEQAEGAEDVKAEAESSDKTEQATESEKVMAVDFNI